MGNGGSEYVYVPDHDPTSVAKVVTVLQSREEVGAIFVDRRYEVHGRPLAGTLSLDTVRVADARLGDARRNPDIIASYAWDAETAVGGVPGIEFEAVLPPGLENRGAHGAFSPVDVHNVLVASGPSFRQGWVDPLPTGNVDVAPTLAWLLGLSLPRADGRPLFEALGGSGITDAAYATRATSVTSSTRSGLTVQRPTDPSPSPATVEAGVTTYRVQLDERIVSLGKQSWTYFDDAVGVRE